MADIVPSNNSEEIARLISEVRPEVVVPQSDSGSTIASRKLQLRQALEDYDVDRLLELQQTMTAFVDLVTNSALTDKEASPVLDGEKAKDLMQRYLDQREIDEFISTVKEMIRGMVFSHMDATLAASGKPDPANTNATLEVPELGRKFCREGAGYKDPSLDEARLQELLGERWDSVCDEIDIPEQIIPAHKDKVLSISKVLHLGRKDPAVMEIIRACIIPGVPKPPRFTVKAMK